jgi:Fe-Mn family superoxide dismutase
MEDNSRRKFVKNAAILTGAVMVGCKTGANILTTDASAASTPIPTPDAPVFKQDPLPYDFAALEPYIDKQTMEIHYGKHHTAYINNLNKALAEQKVTEQSLDKIIASISKYNTATRNNAGGHWNHTQFWKWMKPNGSSTYAGKAADAINAQFGSLDKFKETFTDAAMKRFGSGWAWLVQKDGKLEIISTPNQDNPLMDVAEVKGKPLLGIDVWEHAYYLKYQNLRKDYITNWYNLVNWDEVASLL